MDILKNRVITCFVRSTVIPTIEPISMPNRMQRSRIKCGMRLGTGGMTINGQSGRSTIEMLGVLAIIGVLSVGGIMGFSKAMERYRINETINQVSHIVQNTRDLFKTQPNLYGSMSFNSDTNMSSATSANRKLADKAKLFPDSLVKNGYKNLFGGNIEFYASGRFSENDGKAFLLSFKNIPQEACIELATRDWQSSLGLAVMRIFGSSGSYTAGRTYVSNCKTKFKQGEALICAKNMPATIEQATTACNALKGNGIVWKFY